MGPLPYIPPPLGVKELNLNDAWRAVWYERDELPPDVPSLYGYAVVVSDGKGYAVREAGSDAWGTVEGAIQFDEKPADWLKSAAAAQAGAEGLKPALMGYYECRATSLNPDFPKGATALRPIYLVVARKLRDLGKDSPFERRRLPMNEFAGVLRGRYPELRASITRAVDRYAVLQARGEA
jgi:hypothetical protein